MANYPIRIDISKAKPAKQYREAPPITQRALDSHAARQAMEERSERKVLKAPQVIRTTVAMRPTPMKKGK